MVGHAHVMTGPTSNEAVHDFVRNAVARVQEEMIQHAQAQARPQSDFHLVAVCKRQPEEKVLAAYAAGAREFGESTAQGLTKNAKLLAERGGNDVVWHFIGQLQRNKLNSILPLVSWVHSVDREDLVDAIVKRLGEKELNIFVQVNIAEEAQKGGVLPAHAADLVAYVLTQPKLHYRGLMCLPPLDRDPAPFFLKLRQMAYHVAERFALAEPMLSMGMSDDYGVALAHGATHIRLGTALFGERSS